MHKRRVEYFFVSVFVFFCGILYFPCTGYNQLSITSCWENIMKMELPAKHAPAYLVIFDNRTETKKKSWDERISWSEENGITVLEC